MLDYTPLAYKEQDQREAKPRSEPPKSQIAQYAPAFRFAVGSPAASITPVCGSMRTTTGRPHATFSCPSLAPRASSALITSSPMVGYTSTLPSCGGAWPD